RTGTGTSQGSSGTAGTGGSGGGQAVSAPVSNYVLLKQVAHVKRGTGPNEITRQNNQRYIAITAVSQGRPQSEIQADVQKLLGSYKFPSGYYWDLGVNQKRQREEFAGLGLAVGMAIALIY